MISKIRKQKLQQNIWKFYLYRVFYSLAFTAPIFVLFLLDNQLSMTRVMILQSIYTIIIMISLVPAGMLADKIGRKKIIIGSALFYSLGWFIYAQSYSFYQFAAAELVLALASALISSSGSSFFYDTLKEINQEHRFKKLYGNVVGINNFIWGLAALAGGYLATYSLRLPFYAMVIPALVAFFIAFTFTETKDYKHAEKRYLSHLKEATLFTIKRPRLIILLLYSALIFSTGFTVYMLYQPYLQAVKIPLVYFGAIYFAISIITAIGSKFAHNIEELLGERKTLITILIVSFISCIVMSFLIPYFGVVIPIILSFSAGVLEPVILDYIHKQVESHHRATINSLGNLLTEAFSAVMTPFIGWVVDFWSLSTALLFAGIILLINVVLIVSAFYFINHRRNSQKRKTDQKEIKNKTDSKEANSLDALFLS